MLIVFGGCDEMRLVPVSQAFASRCQDHQLVAAEQPDRKIGVDAVEDPARTPEHEVAQIHWWLAARVSQAASSVIEIQRHTGVEMVLNLVADILEQLERQLLGVLVDLAFLL